MYPGSPVCFRIPCYGDLFNDLVLTISHYNNYNPSSYKKKYDLLTIIQNLYLSKKYLNRWINQTRKRRMRIMAAHKFDLHSELIYSPNNNFYKEKVVSEEWRKQF